MNGLKVIIDPRLISRIESVRLHPNRSFSCENCPRTCTREQVTKDLEGNYHCLYCRKPVEEIKSTDDIEGL